MRPLTEYVEETGRRLLPGYDKRFVSPEEAQVPLKDGEHWGAVWRGHQWTALRMVDGTPPHTEWSCPCGETRWTHGEPPPT